MQYILIYQIMQIVDHANIQSKMISLIFETHHLIDITEDNVFKTSMAGEESVRQVSLSTNVKWSSFAEIHDLTLVNTADNFAVYSVHCRWNSGESNSPTQTRIATSRLILSLSKGSKRGLKHLASSL